jgi:cytochrome P450
MLFDPDFVPFRPPPRPLGLSGLPTVSRNYIETIPQAAYKQGITHVRTRYSDVLLVCEPDVIGEILVERASAFGRDPAIRRSFKPVVGENSIFVAEGAEWRWQRRLQRRFSGMTRYPPWPSDGSSGGRPHNRIARSMRPPL